MPGSDSQQGAFPAELRRSIVDILFKELYSAESTSHKYTGRRHGLPKERRQQALSALKAFSLVNRESRQMIAPRLFRVLHPLSFKPAKDTDNLADALVTMVQHVERIDLTWPTLAAEETYDRTQLQTLSELRGRSASLCKALGFLRMIDDAKINLVVSTSAESLEDVCALLAIRRMLPCQALSLGTVRIGRLPVPALQHALAFRSLTCLQLRGVCLQEESSVDALAGIQGLKILALEDIVTSDRFTQSRLSFPSLQMLRVDCPPWTRLDWLEAIISRSTDTLRMLLVQHAVLRDHDVATTIFSLPGARCLEHVVLAGAWVSNNALLAVRQHQAAHMTLSGTSERLEGAVQNMVNIMARPERSFHHLRNVHVRKTTRAMEAAADDFILADLDADVPSEAHDLLNWKVKELLTACAY